MGRYTRVPSLGSKLENQIAGISEFFPALPEIEGVLLSGSCARGEATYRSDIDLLVILKEGALTYDRVRRVREEIERDFESRGKQILLASPLPVEMTVVLKTVFGTSEPAMKEALRIARILTDPSGELRKLRAA